MSKTLSEENKEFIRTLIRQIAKNTNAFDGTIRDFSRGSRPRSKIRISIDKESAKTLLKNRIGATILIPSLEQTLKEVILNETFFPLKHSMETCPNLLLLDEESNEYPRIESEGNYLGERPLGWQPPFQFFYSKICLKITSAYYLFIFTSSPDLFQTS
jgi:hypothetical protein